MTDRETIRRRIDAVRQRIRDIEREYAYHKKCAELNRMYVQAECSHSETQKYMNYSHFVIDCIDCGKRLAPNFKPLEGEPCKPSS
jgi:hypothetical protein